MAAPILTDAERAQLEKERDAQISLRDVSLAAVPAKIARAAELAVADGSFKKFFDYYNDDIIAQYDAEKRALNGDYIDAPIVEADITEPANQNLTHRTAPALPDTDLLRIAEFDGGPLLVDPLNETQAISDQADVEDVLENGVAGTTPTVTATSLTASNLDSNSTTLDMIDATGPMAFVIGDILVVHDGGSDAAVIEVTGVTDNAGGDPPYDITLDIIFHVEPSGTISSGADVIGGFSGFNNTERTNKVASDSNLQPVIDSLITSLEIELNLRLTSLSEQLVALGLNQDPDAVAEIATTIGLVNTSDSFIDNYLLTTDISDTGLASLASERGSRGSEITTRVSQINANYTGQTENYYDRRYNSGNDRANLSRGTLRLQKNAEDGAVNAQARADVAQDSIDAYDAILAI